MSAPAGSSPAVFFDVDGTLCDTTIAHYFRFFMFQRLPPLHRRIWYAGFLVKCGFYMVLDKFDRGRLNVVFYRNYAGLPTDEIKAQAEPCYHEVIEPRIFTAAPPCAEQHRQTGYTVVLVTGSLDFIVEPLARTVRAEHVLAARLVESGGRFTGALDGPPIGGEEKARRMRDFAATQQIDLARSHAYGDSIADLPMLKVVGHPHAVNPDRGLAAVAAKNRWPVHRWITRAATGRNA